MVQTERDFRDQLIQETVRKDAQKYTDPRQLTRGLDYYEDLLPKYTRFGVFRTGFSDAIGRRALLGRETRVLDVGCGRGVALSQLKSRFGEQVETWGISCTDFRTSSTLDGVDHYIVKDIHDANLREEVPSNYFDVIMGYQAFVHFADPLQALENCWELLKPRGFGFIDSIGTDGLPIYWEGMRIPTFLFVKLLQAQGYPFQRDAENIRRSHDMTFRRNKPHLKLPFEYSGEIEDDPVYEGFGRVKYWWRGKMPKGVAERLTRYTEQEQARQISR